MSRIDNNYFTYRQNPVDYDGTGTIESLKGSTLVWNQLVRNGNFVNTSYWNGNGTKTVSNNEMTYTKPARWNSLSNSQLINLVSSHKYLVMFEAYCENDTMLIFWQTGIGSGAAIYTIPAGTSWQKHSLIVTSVQTTASGRVPSFDNNSAQETIFHLRNYMFIDLTMMGLDALTLDEVKEWLNAYYPLPYYDYNTGTLLSFNGTGIKTVGKNQFNSEHAISATNVVESNDNGTITIKDVSSATWSNAYIGYSDVIAGKEYTFKASLKYGRIGGNLSTTSYPVPNNQPDTSIGNLIFVAVTSVIPSRTFIPNFTGRIYWWYCTDMQNANHQQFTMQPMLSTTDADFEPYTSSTIPLPTQQYFPWGMDGVGTVYDELTQTGYAKRTVYIKLDGSQTWSTRTTSGGFVLYEYFPSNIKNVGTQATAQILNNRYPWNTNLAENKTIRQVNTTITVRRDDITSLQAWYSELASNPLEIVYQLATPLENYGVVDLGSLTWTKESRQNRFNSNVLADAKSVPTSSVANGVCEKYMMVSADRTYLGYDGLSIDSAGRVSVHDTAYSSYTADTFQYYMEGVYLLYEKENPTPIDLDFTYNIYKDGTEQLYPYITIDLGDLDWTAEGSGLGGDYEMTSRSVPFGIDIPSMFSKADISCSAYTTYSYLEVNTGTTGISVNEDGKIVVYDPNYNQFGSASAFKTAMSGVKLTYRIFTTPFYGDIYYRGLIPVSVNVYPLGSGTVTGSGQYRYHEDVTLVATPNDIYRFLRYEDENGDTLSTSPTYTFEVGE